MQILTFNHHESYLTSLAKTGFTFDVVTKRGSLDLSWNVRSRPVPENFRVVEFDDAIKKRLRSGVYDVVICHTIKNLIWMWFYFKPRYVFVAHIPLFRHSPVAMVKSNFKKLTWMTFKATHDASFFAVSHFKQQSWNEKGECAVLAPGDFPALEISDDPSNVLIVCNNLAERGEELGLAMIKRLQKHAPIYCVGNNPNIAFNIEPRNFAHFQELLTGFRIYLYTIRMPHGDGYNTAMLEAMKMGMAIVTVENPTSPIVHGVNGLVGRDEQELLDHIHHLRREPDFARRLGEAAKETVKARFSEEAFVNTWRGVIQANDAF